MKFTKKSSVSADIPQQSLSDIVFMLLFFFMVSTVLRQYAGLNVELPEAEKVEKIESQTHTSYLWIDRNNNWSFNDVPISEERVLYELAYNQRVADPQLIISLKYDRRISMRDINRAQNELRKADALRVNFATQLKTR